MCKKNYIPLRSRNYFCQTRLFQHSEIKQYKLSHLQAKGKNYINILIKTEKAFNKI